jgi:hypothetical protein
VKGNYKHGKKNYSTLNLAKGHILDWVKIRQSIRE